MNNDFTRSLEELEELLDESWSLPIANNKYIINGDKLKSIISDIKLNIPMEMRKSKEILETKEKMLQKAKEDSDAMVEKTKKTSEIMLLKAKKNSETIIEKARLQAEAMLDEQEIIEKAKKFAEDIVERARADALKMRKVTLSYVKDVLNESHKSLEKALNSVSQVRNKYSDHDD